MARQLLSWKVTVLACFVLTWLGLLLTVEPSSFSATSLVQDTNSVHENAKVVAAGPGAPEPGTTDAPRPSTSETPVAASIVVNKYLNELEQEERAYIPPDKVEAEDLRHVCLSSKFFRQCETVLNVYMKRFDKRKAGFFDPGHQGGRGTWSTMRSCSAEAQPQPELFYRHIWKSAGQNIMFNMKALGRVHTPHVLDASWELPKTCSQLLQRDSWGRTPGHGRGILFTFVRDPISRFVSGYTELETRRKFKSPHPRGSVLRAAAFFEETVSHREVNWHVQRQVDFLLHHWKHCPVNFDFIGKLERFDEDISRLGQQLGCELKFDHTLGQHESSSDPFNTSRAMREVLMSDEAVVKLCRYYVLDFLLFNYSMPEACQNDLKSSM